MEYPGDFLGALKTGQNSKSYIFKEIGIPEINVRLFANFQNLIALQVWCIGFTEMVEWYKNGTTFGKNGLNSSRDKNMQKHICKGCLNIQCKGSFQSYINPCSH